MPGHRLQLRHSDRLADRRNVRQRQLADGGWSIYPGGPSELNATCKAYFALKLAGVAIDPTGLQARWSRLIEGQSRSLSSAAELSDFAITTIPDSVTMKPR